MSRYLLLALACLSALSLASCGGDAGTSAIPGCGAELPRVRRAAYVLCEGLYGYDNSTLSRVDLEGGATIGDFIGAVTCSLRIGDTANDMVARGDTAWIAVTASRSIEMYRLSTGRFLGRLRFEGNKEPRSLVISDGATAYVTLLNSDMVAAFDATTLNEMSVRYCSVGPAPEGLALHGSHLLVANSGFGDFRYREPKAGTVSVVDLGSFTEVNTIAVGPNCRDVVSLPEGGFAASYTHLPSRSDSLGGVVVFDAEGREQRRWRLRTPIAPRVLRSGSLACIADSGVAVIDYTGAEPYRRVLRADPLQVWYGISYDAASERLFVLNAKNHTIDGELLEFDARTWQLHRRYPVGLNPNTAVLSSQ